MYNNYEFLFILFPLPLTHYSTYNRQSYDVIQRKWEDRIDGKENDETFSCKYCNKSDQMKGDKTRTK